MKILKSAWKFIILILLIGFGLLYYASNKVDDKYQAAIGLMNNGEWSSGVNLIIETPHYKDASELYIYMYPHKLFYSGYTTEADAIKGFSNAVDFIKLERDKLKGTNSEKYIVELNELEKVLNFKIKELNAKILDEPIKKNLDEGVELIKKGSYQEAVLKLQSIGDDSIYGTDKQELIKYVTLLSVIPSNDLDVITEGIEVLNPNYDGVLAKEIKLTVQTYLDITAWNEKYNVKKIDGEAVNADQITKTPQNGQNTNTVISKSVAVGMKREEVVAILGNPATSNKISNKYGNYEEMIYGSNRFIYFENNIVTTVK
ncbi:MAG: hypothetical protein K0R09_1211 [Clostridiales bacterium]|jgi:hypothetical protein|nr:hypothetical protein [Clostridiales bacterium]